MKTDAIKTNLREYYKQEAKHRASHEKDIWKINLRKMFCDLALKEGKKTIIEIGAGAGQDSEHFISCGFEVLAIDLSSEMVNICKQKNIDAYELDFYNIASLNKKFDCVWSMNSLLHVPKSDLKEVLTAIDCVLNDNGIFFMGVYGGEDTEHNWVNDISETPRFFSYYSEHKLKEVLQTVFDIVSFEQFDVGRNIDFQAVVLRKK